MYKYGVITVILRSTRYVSTMYLRVCTMYLYLVALVCTSYMYVCICASTMHIVLMYIVRVHNEYIVPCT